MTTKRYPGLAKEFVAKQRAAVAPPSILEQGNCPVCLDTLVTGTFGGLECPSCSWTMSTACERCGCTEDNACVDEEGSSPACGWVRVPTSRRGGLCTSCATPQELAAAGLSIQV